MKKIIYSIFAMTLALTGCVSWDDADSESYGEGPAIEAALISATDSAINFTLTPEATAEYYSYALYEGTEATVDALTLLKTTGGGVATGIFNRTESNTASVSLDGLKPNTGYVLYAVASTKEGIIGEIDTIRAKTTDRLIPGISGAKANEDGTVSVTFDDAVSRGEGAVVCTAYKMWDLENPVIVDDSVSIEGNVVTFFAPRAHAGAFLAFNWEEGAFLDAAGNKCATYNKSGLDPEEGEFIGFCNQLPNESFDVTTEGIYPKLDTTFADWTQFYVLIDLKDTCYADVEELTLGEIAVTYENETSAATHKLTFGAHWYLSDGLELGETGRYIYITLPAAPVAGDMVSIHIAEDCVYDVYGNGNNALEISDGWKVSKGYARDLVLGDYTWNYVSFWAEEGETSVENVTLEADPDTEYGVIMKNLWREGTEVYGIFDGESGTLIFGDWQELYTKDTDEGVQCFMFSTYDTENVLFDINADGSMVCDAAVSEEGVAWGVAVTADNADGEFLGWGDLAAGDIYLNPVAEANTVRAIRSGVVHKADNLRKVAK